MHKNLYEKPDSFKLRLFSNDSTWWIVTLIDPVAGNARPDCVVNHPTRKIGFRTKKGLEVERYSSLAKLVWDIKEEGKKYDVKFTKYKVVKNTVEQGRSVVKGGKIGRKIEVQEENLDRIMRVICDSNNLDYAYEVKGVIYGNEFELDSVLKSPIPLVSIVNKENNFNVLKDIVNEHYSELQEYDYKNRGYQYFNNKSPNPVVGGFLVPIYWFDHIEYST